MVLYAAIAILLDVTAAAIWVVKKTANGVYYLVYGTSENENEPVTLEDTLVILKNQNKKILNLQNTVIELTKYIVDNKVSRENNKDMVLSDDNIGTDFIDLKKDFE